MRCVIFIMLSISAQQREEIPQLSPFIKECVWAIIIRDLQIVVYGKRLTPDARLAIKIKSLTVKYITYRIYSKYRKLRIETSCLATETWRLVLNDLVLK